MTPLDCKLSHLELVPAPWADFDKTKWCEIYQYFSSTSAPDGMFWQELQEQASWEKFLFWQLVQCHASLAGTYAINLLCCGHAM